MGSLGLSLLVHAAVLGSLVGVSLFATEPLQPQPRTLVFEAPDLAQLVEPAAPVLPEPEPEPVDTPGSADQDEALDAVELVPQAEEPPVELPGDPRLEVTPSSEWSDERLARRSDFEVRELPPEPEPPVPPALEPPVPPAPALPPTPEAGPQPLEPTPAPLPTPLRLEGRDPEYPRVSLRRSEQGSVTLRLELDADGRVTLVELQSSSGHRRLDQAAMAVAPMWRFELAGLTEADRARGFLHTVHFRL